MAQKESMSYQHGVKPKKLKRVLPGTFVLTINLGTRPHSLQMRQSGLSPKAREGGGAVVINTAPDKSIDL